MQSKNQLFCCALALWVLAFVQTAEADRYDDSELPDQFALRIGSFLVRDQSTRVRVDSSSGVVGTVIDFEQTLNVESSTDVSRLDGYYRFNPRHRIEFSYYKIDRSGTATLLKEIEFGDDTYGIGTQVHTIYNTEIFKLAYSYSFIHVKQFEFAFGAGLHVMKMEIGLDAPGIGEEEKVDGTAPLPVFSFGGRYNLTPKLSVHGKTEHFLINADKYKGVFSDFLLTLEHQTLKNLGFGMGYNRVSFDLEADDGDLRGEVKFNYTGWLIYTKLSF